MPPRVPHRRTAVGRDPGQLEADLVHVRNEHQRTAAAAERHRQVAALVYLRPGPRRQRLGDGVAHRRFVTGDAVRLDERLERDELEIDRAHPRVGRAFAVSCRFSCPCGRRDGSRHGESRGNREQRRQRIDVAGVHGLDRRLREERGHADGVQRDVRPLVRQVQPQTLGRHRLHRHTGRLGRLLQLGVGVRDERPAAEPSDRAPRIVARGRRGPHHDQPIGLRALEQAQEATVVEVRLRHPGERHLASLNRRTIGQGADDTGERQRTGAW